MATFFLFVSLTGLTQNLLTDGDFSATTDIENCYGYPPPGVWCEYISYYIAADATVVDGVCNYSVINPGSENWEVQLIQAGFNLESGHTYRLSFDVKGDKDASFGVFLGENEGNWTNFIGYDRYWHNATTEWQNITMDFNVPCTFPYYKLSFEFGLLENTTLYFDNISLTDQGPYIPTIGIIGTAVNGGWDVDVDMQTTDGITYSVSGVQLSNGYMKFRQDHMWCINWGGTDFPEGIGYQYGPDILIPSFGNYDITFNRQTGAYSIICVANCAPLIGIIGTAVTPYNDWNTDVNLVTGDGVNFSLMNYYLTEGEAKFRQDDSWDINWGNNTFPDGTAALNGPAIPVKEGVYNVSFNITTGNYSFAFQNIGILGSALNGWDDDIDLSTADGINYTLENLDFNSGEVKFRAENNWYVNWGGYDFPQGWAYSNGPNIPVMAGNYDVYFNALTGEYKFTATSCPVAGIQCPWDQYFASEPETCGAVVYYPDVTAAPDCGGEGIVITQTAGLPSGSFFPAGATVNSFVLTNKDGNTATCSFTIYVLEFEPPEITLLNETFEPLWPPNHKMVDITLDYTATDNCSTPSNTLYVWSDEPEEVSGTDDTAPDWEILDDHHLRLRAERSEQGPGRTYYIWIISYDASWNYAERMITIEVPHDYNEFVNSRPATNKSASIKDPESTNVFKVNIWPNPAKDKFNLEIQSPENPETLVSVCDVTGRQVWNKNVPDKQIIQFGDELIPGIYLVKVQNGYRLQNFKIIKQ